MQREKPGRAIVERVVFVHEQSFLDGLLIHLGVAVVGLRFWFHIRLPCDFAGRFGLRLLSRPARRLSVRMPCRATRLASFPLRSPRRKCFGEGMPDKLPDKVGDAQALLFSQRPHHAVFVVIDSHIQHSCPLALHHAS